MARLSRFRNVSIVALFMRRLLLAGFFVFATYNPTGRSYYHWLMQDAGPLTALQVLVGVVLLIGLVAMMRMAVVAMRVRGVIAVIGLFFGGVLLRVGLGLEDFDDIHLTGTAVQLVICGILATGMTWAHAQIRFSGERDVLHFPP